MQPRVPAQYPPEKVRENPDMLPTAPRRMLDGLTAAASRLGARLDLQELWADPAQYDRHLRKRIALEHVGSAQDYERRTWNALAAAVRIVVVQEQDPAMRATGKIEVRDNVWAVLLSEGGRIVTSYPVDPGMPQFEERHRQKGDQVNVYTIDAATRARLARLFGHG